MRNLRESIICMASVLLLAALAAGDEPQLSSTRTASCIVTITVAPALMPLTVGTVEGLVHSSGVAGKAVRDVLEPPNPDVTQEVLEGIEIEWLSQRLADSYGTARQPSATNTASFGRAPALLLVDEISGEAGGSGENAEEKGSARGGRSGATAGMSGGMDMGRGMGGGMGLYGGGRGGVYGMPTAPAPTADMPQSATIRLSVHLPDEVKPVAEEFLIAIVQNLRQALGSSEFDYRGVLENLVDQAEARCQSATEELRKLLDDGVDAGTMQAEVEDLQARRRELKASMQNIEVDLFSMDARREAIEKQIAITRREVDEKQRGDEIMGELADILRTNEELLSTMTKSVQAGRSGTGELAKAKEGVMQARIELARRREELAKSGGGERLSQYSADLGKMAVDDAENKARLAMLREQLAEINARLKQASKLDPKAVKIRAAKQAVDIAEYRVGELKRRLAELEPPIVTVIGAN